MSDAMRRHGIEALRKHRHFMSVILNSPLGLLAKVFV
jgi:hypothetical protein